MPFLLLWVLLSSSAVAIHNCPLQESFLAFYQVEVFIGSRATFCNDNQKRKVSQLLSRLMHETFNEVPSIIEAEVDLCLLPRVVRRRRALEDNQILQLDDGDEVVSPSFLLGNNATNKNHHEGNTSLLLVDNVVNDKFTLLGDGGDDLPSLFFLDSPMQGGLDHAGVANGTFQVATTTTKDTDNTTTLSPSLVLVDSEEMQRFLRRGFVYEGGMRCRYCNKDNYDQRRQLQSCRQHWQTLYSSGNGWHRWHNRRRHFFKGRWLLGPYRSGNRFSKTIHVPAGITVLEVEFPIYQSQFGPEWGSHDAIVVRVNGYKPIYLRHLKHKDYRYRTHDWFSGAEEFVRDRGNLLHTKVVLRIDLVRTLTDLNRNRHQGKTVTLGFKVETNNNAKQAALGHMRISGIRTCANAIANFNQVNNIPASWTFEQIMEWKLSMDLTRKFRQAVAHNHRSCFYRKNPTIYANLYEKNSYNEARPACLN